MSRGAATVPGAVVFDLGGVLLDWDPRYLYRRLLDESEVDAFLTEVDFAAWNHRQDMGEQSWAAAVDALAARHPHRRELIAAYPQRFRETISGPIDESVTVVRELNDRGTRLFALTNWSAETFAGIRGEFDFLGLFEGIVVSGEERLGKPDPRIFRLLLDRFGLAARDTVFVDDSPANIAAAQASGMVTLLFRTPRQLRADLGLLGLLSTRPADDTGPSGIS